VVCDRVRAYFHAPMPQLQPLPIMGLGYRWSLDFAGPLPVIPRHNKYVLVMIEHFSKWIELVALPDKFSEGAAYSFLDRVLSRFGAPTEVLTDQGREFLGEFQTLCEQAMIDHCTTSRDHPEANGLVERMVQTVKKGLWKYNLKKGHHGDWDL
jgi:transposase InsO family protein